MTGTPWVVVSNWPIPGFDEALSPAEWGDVRVYTSGRAPAPESDGCTFAVEAAGTAIHVAEDRVRVTTSGYNTTPVYFAAEAATGRFIVGTDLPTTAAAFAALTGTPAALRDEIGVQLGSQSAVFGVERLEHLIELDIRRESGAWLSKRTRQTDPAETSIRFREALPAGRAQVDALRAAIAAALATETEVGVLVSGGVDSGLVAALVAESGASATAYTIGTEWGNEFDHAAEAAQAVGLDLRVTALGADDVVAALPATVRAFGHDEPQTIAIGVALTAFCQGRHAAERLLLTGYGSDLLNSGMATTDEIDGDIGAKVREAVHRTRYSSEFTSALGDAAGYRLTHPYWHVGVLDVALATDPAVKTFRGREKGHLRIAARDVLPESVAWRPKTAIHHGNGLGDNLVRLVDTHTGVSGGTRLVYRALLASQIALASQNPLASLTGREAYDRAVAQVARTS
ncbi:asparagine synthase-related protein [Streptomyces sp. B-S-A8]|uniref:Asparagine synthase-related protein n=1 Tax=Streptomyces solicavernae TaxID=3043614 RepID=A0ABT6RY64_9ACTN|nr:asparagine synthase-related protein [Streptomyces sp. B-S-A8]MDI3389347.1 asparagine synthase-related protein [Streptomyces sp. B-S-A8]